MYFISLILNVFIKFNFYNCYNHLKFGFNCDFDYFEFDSRCDFVKILIVTFFYLIVNISKF